MTINEYNLPRALCNMDDQLAQAARSLNDAQANAEREQLALVGIQKEHKACQEKLQRSRADLDALRSADEADARKVELLELEIQRQEKSLTHFADDEAEQIARIRQAESKISAAQTHFAVIERRADVLAMIRGVKDIEASYVQAVEQLHAEVKAIGEQPYHAGIFKPSPQLLECLRRFGHRV